MLPFSARTALLLTTCILSSALAPIRAEAADDAAIAKCDALAASPLDATRPAGVAGIASGKIDVEAAKTACEAAAASAPDDARIQFQYGRVLVLAKDPKAFTVLGKAAKAGHIIAISNLGYAYEHGIGTKPDLAKAMQNYRKAADKGLPTAQYNLGMMYLNGKGIKSDAQQAVMWLGKAADQKDAESLNQLGLIYDDGIKMPQDFAKSAAYYKAAIDAGSSAAYANLGWMYDRGVGGLPKDHEKANELYLAGADKGNTNAMNNYAESLLTGEGVAKDEKAGMEWMHKAYDAGSSRAAYNLGMDYADAVHVAHDASMAADYLMTALERGSPDAYSLLAEHGGEGMAPDVADALQDKLLQHGVKIKKQPGALGKDAVKYIASHY